MASKVVSPCIIKISDLTESQKRKLLRDGPHHKNTSRVRSFAKGFGEVRGQNISVDAIRRLLKRTQRQKAKKSKDAARVENGQLVHRHQCRLACSR